VIEVSVVTGFLGSGKTTLIARLLRDPAAAGTLVIVNEFGEVSLDHDLLAASTDATLLALPSGCLCCTVRGDLVRTLLDLAAQRAAGAVAYGRVLIETSGLADPAPILHALMTDPAVVDSHRLAGLTTLVDAGLGAATLAQHREARRQVGFADRIVLSKTDLAAPTPALRDAIAALNPGAPVVGTPPSPADIFAVASHATAPDAFAFAFAFHGRGASLVVHRRAPVPALALTLWLQALAEHCGARLWRLKGLVDVAEMPGQPAAIHVVQHVVAAPDFLARWPRTDRSTRIVLIGDGIPRHFPARLLEAVIDDVEDEARRLAAG
jgi:G3E family GTPase